MKWRRVTWRRLPGNQPPLFTVNPLLTPAHKPQHVSSAYGPVNLPGSGSSPNFVPVLQANLQRVHHNGEWWLQHGPVGHSQRETGGGSCISAVPAQHERSS